jgi:glycerophosphoryl diester phosphodiesterase
VSAFWDYPRIRDSIEIDAGNRLLRIDTRTFRIPVLVQLNDELETTLSFDVDRGMGDNVLVGLLQHLDKNSGFLLIDECRNARKLDKSLGTTGLCFLAGKGDTYYKIVKLKENLAYSSRELRRLLKLDNGFEARRIAHAGGGIGSASYTNSYEALNSNLGKGFQYFKLDFSFTKDDRLVCLHDWQDNFTSVFGFETRDKLTLKEFKSLSANKAKFKPCTLDGLISWMKDHPAAFIVTDVKEDNEKALRMLLKKLPDAKRRVIPQIYEPMTFSAIKKMGFEQIIWTLYRYSGTNDRVLEWVDKFDGPIAVTMPKGRAASFLPKALKIKHIPTYVHTVNSPEEKTRYASQFGVTEVYTDFLPPYDASETPYAESVPQHSP